MKKTSILCLMVMAVGLLAWAGAAMQSQELPWKNLKSPGNKNRIDDSTYFIYKPSEKPKLGTVILSIQVFNKSAAKDTSFVIKGQYGMPSMPGAHDSGLQTFSLNKAGNYLLPINIVMPGEWEVRLTFFKGNKPVYRGHAKFNV